MESFKCEVRCSSVDRMTNYGGCGRRQPDSVESDLELIPGHQELVKWCPL